MLKKWYHMSCLSFIYSSYLAYCLSRCLMRIFFKICGKHGLSKHLKPKDADHTVVKAMKKIKLTDLKTRYKTASFKGILELGIILDQRVRNHVKYYTEEIKTLLFVSTVELNKQNDVDSLIITCIQSLELVTLSTFSNAQIVLLQLNLSVSVRK
ncbi:unnamed protein product [Meganyctiphanes norvegica]|uniref:Uncharacterized protein n=1 Tax=Meganyctiphanes norvegica TaxID=48144 RepID=A0AAV2R2N2_MEGNR